MQIWRKRMRTAGVIFSALLFLFLLLLNLNLFDAVNSQTIVFLPILLVLFAGASFGGYTASPSADRNAFGGNIFLGILIFLIGCALAVLWFVAGLPEI